MGRRVVVTGMGILSPTGNTVNEAWNNVKNGINGIGPLTKAGAEDLPVHFAGELKNLDPLDFLDKKEVRRYDEYAQYGVIAGSQAMADAGLDLSLIHIYFHPYRLHADTGLYRNNGIPAV